MTIATVSLEQLWEEKEENLLLCQSYIEEAASKAVDLIIFPEMTLTGFSTHIDFTAEEERHSKTIQSFQELAQTFKIAILFGVVVKDNLKALNKSIFLDSDGSILADYAKIHPFSFSGEDNYFNPGQRISTFQFQGLNIGLSICYDLRFPELYSALAKKSDIIINIANWPQKRVQHWKTLLQARAIENQTYIIGVNRTGVDGNALKYEESSNIFNANGDTVTFEQSGNMKIHNIDKAWTQKFKSNFSTVQDRQESLYREII